MKTPAAPPPAFYNDNDPKTVDWLLELVRAGTVPHGIVDHRSIAEITPGDVSPYRHCHFFAGIGGWAHALQLAGWPDHWTVWTGSPPCTPFSQAGLQKGTDDERHLWPVFRDLIEQCRPAALFGEQVGSKLGRAWLATVQDNLEKLGYSTAAADLPACGVGAPHIRQRLYWVGLANGARPQQRRKTSAAARHGNTTESASGDGVGLGNSTNTGPQRRERAQPCQGSEPGRAGPWGGVEYLPCTDGKARPVKPGLEPLVNGIPDGLVRGGDQRLAPDRSPEGRVMRLRGYGNAIVPRVAAVFIRSVVEAFNEHQSDS